MAFYEYSAIDLCSGEDVNYGADDFIKIQTRLAGHWPLYKPHLSNISISNIANLLQIRFSSNYKIGHCLGALLLSGMAYNNSWIVAACLIVMAVMVSAHEGHDHKAPTPAPSKGGSSSLASPFPAALIVGVVGFVFSMAKI